jgi:hypothetical protein
MAEFSRLEAAAAVGVRHAERRSNAGARPAWVKNLILAESPAWISF